MRKKKGEISTQPQELRKDEHVYFCMNDLCFAILSVTGLVGFGRNRSVYGVLI